MGDSSGSHSSHQSGRPERCVAQSPKEYVSTLGRMILRNLVGPVVFSAWVLAVPPPAASQDGATIARLRNFVLSAPEKLVSPHAEFIINVDPARVAQPFRARAFRGTREELVAGGKATGDGCRLYDSVILSFTRSGGILTFQALDDTWPGPNGSRQPFWIRFEYQDAPFVGEDERHHSAVKVKENQRAEYFSRGDGTPLVVSDPVVFRSVPFYQPTPAEAAEQKSTNAKRHVYLKAREEALAKQAPKVKCIIAFKPRADADGLPVVAYAACEPVDGA